MTRAAFALAFLTGCVVATFLLGQFGNRALDRLEREWPGWV